MSSSFFLITLLAVSLIACKTEQVNAQATAKTTALDANSKVAKIIKAARWQIGKTVSYDPAYVALQYPNGDLPIEKGVCTDVIIRALRKGIDLDLQKVVHEDMKKNFSKYPKIWGLKRPDKNIDHRRVPNLQTYFKRQGWNLAVSQDKSKYQAGDLVTCKVGGKLPHIMIVTEKKAEDGTPLVIHNIGSGTQEENVLFSYKLTGHYRIRKRQ